MPTPRLLPFLLLVWLVIGRLSLPATAKDRTTGIASLIDPAKLATLKQRGANPRVQKFGAQLAAAKQAGEDPAKVAKAATSLAGYRDEAARLTVEAMVRNLTIAERLGCLDA